MSKVRPPTWPRPIKGFESSSVSWELLNSLCVLTQLTSHLHQFLAMSFSINQQASPGLGYSPGFVLVFPQQRIQSRYPWSWYFWSGNPFDLAKFSQATLVWVPPLCVPSHWVPLSGYPLSGCPWTGYSLSGRPWSGYSLGIRGHPQALGAIPWHQGLSPGRQGLSPGRQGLSLGVRGYPLGVRGYPPGVRGYPLGVRGYPLGVRGYPLGVRGYSPGVSSLLRQMAQKIMACKIYSRANTELLGK